MAFPKLPIIVNQRQSRYHRHRLVKLTQRRSSSPLGTCNDLEDRSVKLQAASSDSTSKHDAKQIIQSNRPAIVARNKPARYRCSSQAASAARIPTCVSKQTAREHYASAFSIQSNSSSASKQRRPTTSAFTPDYICQTSFANADKTDWDKLYYSTSNHKVEPLQVIPSRQYSSRNSSTTTRQPESRRPSISVVRRETLHSDKQIHTPGQSPSLRAATFQEVPNNRNSSPKVAIPADTDTAESKMGKGKGLAVEHATTYPPTPSNSPSPRMALITPPEKQDNPVVVANYSRPTNSSQRRVERAQPVTPIQSRQALTRSNEVLSGIIDMVMLPRTDRIPAAHGAIIGAQEQEPGQVLAFQKSSQTNLTALPPCNLDKPLPALQHAAQDTPRSMVPLIRSVRVQPPACRPYEHPSFLWVSEQTQTSRPVDAWAASKRWTCCECKSQTIVEQQICSKLCCQHTRCSGACGLARYC